jgi:hypothetical protein
LTAFEPGVNNFVAADVDAGMKESISAWITE